MWARYLQCLFRAALAWNTESSDLWCSFVHELSSFSSDTFFYALTLPSNVLIVCSRSWSIHLQFTDSSSGLCLGEEKQAPAPVLQVCGFYDVEQVQLLTQGLLVTLGTACVEKTAGDPFSQRAAVLPDIKKEMLEFLVQHSEAYASGSGFVSSQGMGQVRNNHQYITLSCLIHIYLLPVCKWFPIPATLDWEKDFAIPVINLSMGSVSVPFWTHSFRCRIVCYSAGSGGNISVQREVNHFTALFLKHVDGCRRLLSLLMWCP